MHWLLSYGPENECSVFRCSLSWEDTAFKRLLRTESCRFCTGPTLVVSGRLMHDSKHNMSITTMTVTVSNVFHANIEIDLEIK